MKESEFKKIHNEYYQRFGTYLPLMELTGTYEEIAKIIKDCLQKGEPFEEDEDDDLIY